MSKYSPLWQWIAQQQADDLLLTYDEIAAISGFPIDHAFLTFKKELAVMGWQVGKISMKAKTVAFHRLPENADDT